MLWIPLYSNEFYLPVREPIIFFNQFLNLKIIISLSGYSGGILLYQLIPFIIRLFPRNLEINYLMLFQVILFILIAVFSLLLFDGRIAKDFNLKNRNLSEKKPLFFSSARYVKLFSIMALGLFLYSLRDIFNDTSYIINYAHFFLNVLQFHNISILLPIFSIFGYFTYFKGTYDSYP